MRRGQSCGQVGDPPGRPGLRLVCPRPWLPQVHATPFASSRGPDAPAPAWGLRFLGWGRDCWPLPGSLSRAALTVSSPRGPPPSHPRVPAPLAGLAFLTGCSAYLLRPPGSPFAAASHPARSVHFQFLTHRNGRKPCVSFCSTSKLA